MSSNTVSALTFDTSDTFDRPRPVSEPDTEEQRSPSLPFNLFRFLGLVQKLDVEILPVTWEQTRISIGSGGTSRINQLQLSDGRSLAFKRLFEGHTSDEAESRAFRLAYHELVALTQYDKFEFSSSQTARLQGICWEIDSANGDIKNDNNLASTSREETLWPVLVFEMAKDGDLLSFITSKQGKSLEISARLEFCRDLYDTIARLHAYSKFITQYINAADIDTFVYIVHGDLKPQNVLVKDGQAMLIDFGYSTVLTAETDYLHLPKSWPWYAPEHGSLDRFTPAQARKADVFSLGMLCVWILFEEYLTGDKKLPGIVATWAERYFNIAESSDQAMSMSILDKLKHDDKLKLLATQLIGADTILKEKVQQSIITFFEQSLSVDPDLRIEELGSLLSDLDGIDSGYELRREIKPSVPVTDAFHDTDCNFKVVRSVQALYQVDYRVRQIIRTQLERCVLESKGIAVDTNLVMQLALCYKIGFGGERDDQTAFELLESNDIGLDFLDGQIEYLQTIGTLNQESKHKAQFYMDLAKNGFISDQQFIDQCCEEGRAEEALQILHVEIGPIERLVGIRNPIWLFHAQKIVYLSTRYHDLQATGETLAGSLQDKSQGKLPDAHEINVKIKSVTSRTNKRGSSIHEMRFWEHLQKVKGRKGEWDDEIEQCLKFVTMKIQLSSHTQLVVFRSLPPLHEGPTSQQEGPSSEKSGEVELELNQIGSDTLRMLRQMPGGPTSKVLSSAREIISHLKSYDKWTAAEALEREIIRALRRQSGSDHPEMLYSMINLAKTYQHLDYRTMSLELFIDMSDCLKSQLGETNEATLMSLNILSLAYRNHGRFQEAEELEHHLAGTSVSKYVNLSRQCATDLEPSHPLDETFVQDSAEQLGHGLSEEATQLDFAIIHVRNKVVSQGWVRRKNEEGHYYWLNKNDQRHSWERPPLHDAQFIVPVGWDCATDSEGRLYWRDHRTGTTCWERPSYVPRGWETRRDTRGNEFWFDAIRNITTSERPCYLPAGWELCHDHLNRVYYIDHGTSPDIRLRELPEWADFFQYQPAYGYHSRYDKKGRLFWAENERDTSMSDDSDDEILREPIIPAALDEEVVPHAVAYQDRYKR